MKNNTLNFKILFLLVSLLTILFLSSTSVLASTDSYSFVGFDGINYTLPSLPTEIIDCNSYIIASFGDYIYAFGSDADFNISWAEDKITLKTSDGSNLVSYSLNSVNDTLWHYDINSYDNASSLDTAVVLNCSDNLLVYKNHFISREDFFTIPLPVTLVPIVQEIQLEGVLKEIIMILPIALVTIVGLIGLRKALKFLSTVLHRS